MIFLGVLGFTRSDGDEGVLTRVRRGLKNGYVHHGYGDTPHMGPGEALAGGAEGTRTPDPLLAKQVLSQLSYSPMTPS